MPKNVHFNLILCMEQEGQNHDPLGTETKMGLTQNKW